MICFAIWPKAASQTGLRPAHQSLKLLFSNWSVNRPVLEGDTLLADDALESGGRWQHGPVLPCEDAVVLAFRKCQFDGGVIDLLATEQNANGRILIWQLHDSVIIMDIHLHLPQILMRDLGKFQVKHKERTRQAVVEYEIDRVMLFIECETDLPPDKCEAFAKFKHEFLNMVDDSDLYALTEGKTGNSSGTGLIGGMEKTVCICTEQCSEGNNNENY